MLLSNFFAPKDKQPLTIYKRLVITPFDGEVNCRTNPLLSVENARERTISGYISYWIKKDSISINQSITVCRLVIPQLKEI